MPGSSFGAIMLFSVRKLSPLLNLLAGCDMFLFNRMPEDDFNFMMNGYKNGVITEERLEEALTRILGLKARLSLHKKSLAELVPNNFDKVNLKEHRG